jgi:hypothetical protein
MRRGPDIAIASPSPAGSAISGADGEIAAYGETEAACVRGQPCHLRAFDARAFPRRGQFDRAIACYDIVARIKSNHTSSLYGRGLARRQTGDSAGGNSDVAAASAIEPDIVERFARDGLS